MSFLPTFLNLDNKKVVIIGGGVVASAKLKYLLDFVSDITVIAPKISTQMSKMIDENSLIFEKRVYEKGDLSGFYIAIVAIDDLKVQKSIYADAKSAGVMCSVVDSGEDSDFITPSYIKKDDLVITISTSGNSPAFAKSLRLFIEDILPSDVGKFLKEMKRLRDSLPKGKERMKMLKNKARDYIKGWI